MPNLKSLEDFEEKWEQIAPYKGAQLRVKRSFYFHHGIYTGNSVVHFGEGDTQADMFNSDGNIVHETSLEEFLQGGVLEVRVYSEEEKAVVNAPDEIIVKAIVENADNTGNIIDEDAIDVKKSNIEDKISFFICCLSAGVII